MNAEEQLQRIKEMNRKRQANFYAKHKEAVNAKRREIYKAGREKLHPQEIEEDHEEELQPVQTNFSKKRTITYEEAVNALDGLQIKDATRLKYKQDLKRLMNLTDCNDNLIKCFRDYKSLIEIINTSHKPNGEPYSINTRKSLIQMVLYLIDKLQLPITKTIKNHYIKQFDISKIASSDENVEKQENTTIISFKDYLQKIKDEFGSDSKEFVLSCLYREITLRDDFILKIVPTIKSADNNNINYIVVPKKENMTVIINQYKTSDKYGEIKVKLSTSLSKLIRNFIKVEKLEYDNFLFGSKNLTQFVTKMNNKIGVHGGISLYRKMSVSELLSNNPSPEERAELSRSMAHSPIVQLRYLRKVI
jgi:hypothetical protein